MAKDPNVEADKIFIALGRALSRWSIVEDTLCTVFCLATGDINNAHAFWAIMSFEAKLTMTHAVVTAKFRGNDKVLALWQTAYNELRRKNQKRNKLAHGTVVTFQFKPKGKPLQIHTHLCPYYMAALRRMTTEHISETDDLRPKDRLSEPDIAEIERAFRRVDASLSKAHCAMYSALHPPKSAASEA